MKTIAIAAVFVMLTAPTWADEAERQIHDPASSNEPIVLSESEMDGVTAGVQWVLREGYLDTLHDLASTSASSNSRIIADAPLTLQYFQINHY